MPKFWNWSKCGDSKSTSIEKGSKRHSNRLHSKKGPLSIGAPAPLLFAHSYAFSQTLIFSVHFFRVVRKWKTLSPPDHIISYAKCTARSIYKSIAHSCILYNDLSFQAKFVLTIWTNCKKVKPWYEYDMVDYREKDKHLVFAVYKAYCKNNFQPTLTI
jgi:hypothetical protein